MATFLRVTLRFRINHPLQPLASIKENLSQTRAFLLPTTPERELRRGSHQMDEPKWQRYLRKRVCFFEVLQSFRAATGVPGEPLFEFGTDKAVVELEAPADGKLSKIVADVGTTVAIGDLIGVIVLPK